MFGKARPSETGAWSDALIILGCLQDHTKDEARESIFLKRESGKINLEGGKTSGLTQRQIVPSVNSGVRLRKINWEICMYGPPKYLKDRTRQGLEELHHHPQQGLEG